MYVYSITLSRPLCLSKHIVKTLLAAAPCSSRIQTLLRKVSYYTSCSTTKIIMADFVFYGEDIPFCPGPCKSFKHEGKPRKINNDSWYEFKPYNGGRYIAFTWPLSDGGSVTVRNIRLCGCCNTRYQEIALYSDGDIVLKKLQEFLPEIAPEGPVEDE